MTQTPPTDAESQSSRNDSQPEPRKLRTVRFTDVEWEEVREAAIAHDVPVAEFVRKRMLAVARARPGAEPPATPADLAPLIERTCRYTYMLATRMRDEMAREGRGEEMEEFVAEAQELQRSLRRGAAQWSPLPRFRPPPAPRPDRA